MNWIPWPESIKKRACRYILQNYVGDYLHEKIRLEQLNVDLYQGTRGGKVLFSSYSF